MSRMRGEEGLGNGEESSLVCELSASDVRDSRDDLPRHTKALADVVPSDVVRHEPEIGRQRARFAARSGFGQLPDGLGLAAQAPPSDGPT